jgi:threonine/homoserine/homoserine lactone efflux protein
MSGVIIAAFQLGFVYSLLPGPILIASSQRVVTGGWRQGCWFILGVTLADLLYIAVIHWGLTSLLNNQFLSIGLWILGGGWLIKLGVDALRIPSEDQSLSKAAPTSVDSKRTLADGLFINLLNPLTVVGWVALGANFIALSNPTVVTAEAGNLMVLFVILAGILTWQLLVVGFVSIVRQQIPGRLLKSLSLVGGICLVAYGIGAWVSAVNLLIEPALT